MAVFQSTKTTKHTRLHLGLSQTK